jgi:hypothetical protein
VREYVQEQAVTTLAIVADASETTFRKVSSLHFKVFVEFTLLQHYSTVMPLLNILRNVNGPGYRKLRVKAMECAGLIGLFLNALYQFHRCC